MQLLKAAVAQRPGVLCEEISKLYWNRFAYKVEVGYARHGDFHTFFKHVPDLTEVDHRTRREGRRFAVYFVDEQDAVAYANAFAGTPYALAIAGPVNTQALSTLRGDAKARIRKTLFWGQYRWCVNISWRESRKIVEMRNWVQELLINEPKDAAPRCLVATTYPYRVFFRDEADVILFKMIYAECFASIEVVVLREELA